MHKNNYIVQSLVLHRKSPAPTFITKQREVKNNVALVQSFHEVKAFCLSYFISFGKILEKKKLVSQHHYDHSRRNYIMYIEAEVGVM